MYWQGYLRDQVLVYINDIVDNITSSITLLPVIPLFLLLQMMIMLWDTVR